MQTQKSVGDFTPYALESAQLSYIVGGCATYVMTGHTNWGDPDKCTFDVELQAEDHATLDRKCEVPDSQYNLYFCDKP